MPLSNEGNILHIGPPQRPGDHEIKLEMAEAVVARIKQAGGFLAVRDVLREHLYDPNTATAFFWKCKNQ